MWTRNADPGARPHAAGAADAARVRRGSTPRLRPQRHHHPVRRPQRRYRAGDRRDATAAPRRGVPPFLNQIDADRAGGTSTCTSCSTTPGRTRPRRSSAGWFGTRASRSLHPTYSSWLNLVERWFAELTTKWIRNAAGLRPDVHPVSTAARARARPEARRRAGSRRPRGGRSGSSIIAMLVPMNLESANHRHAGGLKRSVSRRETAHGYRGTQTARALGHSRRRSRSCHGRPAVLARDQCPFSSPI